MIKKYFYFIFILNCLLLNSTSAQNKEIVAYYTGAYSKNHLAQEKYLMTKNLVDKITVINYAFARPIKNSDGNIIPFLSNSFYAYQEYYSTEMSVDGIADNSNQKLRGQFNQLKKLKQVNPNLKILISIGGWGGSKYFSDLALTESSREYFVDSCIDMFIEGNFPIADGAGGKESGKGVFDGIDLDWEFPLAGGPEGTHYNPGDRENHSALLKLFREKLDSINKNLLLTIAVTGRSNEFWQYNFHEDQKYLNWFNLMSYDLHGSADNITGHHTNLLSSKYDSDPKRESLDRMVRYLLDSAGVTADKIIPGAAYYGKGWADVDSINHGLYQPGNPKFRWGYIKFKNFLDYTDVKKRGFEYFWDDNTLAASLYNKEEKIFWTYDDVTSIALKSRYVDAYNLRGLMFWQIFGDDTLGTLTNTIYNRNMPDVTLSIPSKINKPPSVEIISPNNKSKIYSEGDVIIIKNKSEDTDGEVIKVEYFINDISIGYNTVSPFNWAWFNAAKGEHQLSCIAFDNNGGKKYSEKINLIIQ